MLGYCIKPFYQSNRCQFCYDEVLSNRHVGPRGLIVDLVCEFLGAVGRTLIL
jgi:hypothetical protein